MKRVVACIVAALVLGGCTPRMPDVAPGVSRALADFRKSSVSDVRYQLSFVIPPDTAARVTGKLRLRLKYDARNSPLVLDFDTKAGSISSVRSAGSVAPFTIPDGHVVIDAAALKGGEEDIEIDFVSSDGALNRQPEFLYSLFVPDRAATAFPCFNQPDIKARYSLTLEVPQSWQAVSNGSEASRDSARANPIITFTETKPISTYLFAFSAGKFQVEQAERNGRTFRMYHRETDSAKVRRNRDAIFDLHAASLAWLESYTSIPFPFEKFDFVAVPAFQFGGMEHPGAIWYRATGLFLDESPTTTQQLGRASLIAHETAHMWFGNLVTMQWFNDVWMKEVFANFMAAKIVAPSFPEINHDLRFLLAHHPTAYDVDRTAGANPIRQPLDNLREAGSLYGAIIYQKAPVVMRHLERLVGEEGFRDGLREYLRRFSFANATWSDLIAILDAKSDEDLAAWSKVWVEEPGRPQLSASLTTNNAGALQKLRVTSKAEDAQGSQKSAVHWNQRLAVVLGYADTARVVRVHLREDEAVSDSVAGWRRPDYLLPGADGVAYGHVMLDSASREWLLQNVHVIREPLVRTGAWMALWESVLYSEIQPTRFIALALDALPRESDELIVQHVLGLLETSYWRYLDSASRDGHAPRVESVLWAELQRATAPSRKRAYFNALVSVSLTESGVQRLKRIWSKDEKVEGVPLSEDQFIDLAKALAVRGVKDAEAILAAQLARITNADRKARFGFVIPSLSRDRAQRDSVFFSFRDAANRKREAWVLEAQAQINHPLRANSATGNLEAALDLVEEIQRTGDIFFPLRWLNATLGGHQTKAAAGIVSQFLAKHPEYPPRLRAKILQASDELNRAARIVGGPDTPPPG